MNELQNTKQWFEQAVPTPTEEKIRVQIGCHIEEFAEMLASVGLHEWAHDIDLLSTDLKIGDDSVSNLEINKLALLDSLADQIVTAIGVAHMLDMDIEGALAEVNRSNFSKFENGTPVFDDNGKIKKGKNYSKPDLHPYIGGNNENGKIPKRKDYTPPQLSEFIGDGK